MAIPKVHPSHYQHQHHRRRGFLLSSACLLLLLLLLLSYRYEFGWWQCPDDNTTISKSTSSVYRGHQYWKPGVTQSVRTILETPFARFQVHEIQWNNVIIKDWLWFDEPDNVNVLVQCGPDEFWILEQTKYGIIETTTYAVIGGLMEDMDNGDPLKTAQRELKEELQLQSSQWKKLGHFVAAANRGGGTTHVFWAQGAVPINDDSNKATLLLRDKSSVAEGELERQDIIRLSRSQLLEALLSGKFREMKWTATVALALLQEQQQQQ